MNFDKIKGLVGDLAPTLGAALGGPVGGAAATMLADVLGCDPTPQKIGKALSQATPEQLAEIKKAELDFEVRMKELEVDVFALETKDIQHARESFSEDWTARAIALLSILLLAATCFSLLSSLLMTTTSMSLTWCWVISGASCLLW